MQNLYRWLVNWRRRRRLTVEYNVLAKVMAGVYGLRAPTVKVKQRGRETVLGTYSFIPPDLDKGWITLYLDTHDLFYPDTHKSMRRTLCHEVAHYVTATKGRPEHGTEHNEIIRRLQGIR